MANIGPAFNSEGQLHCWDCSQWMDPSAFPRVRSLTRGYGYRCKACMKANRDKTGYHRKYHIENRERILAYHSEHRHNNPEHGRNAQHKRRALMYGNGPVERFTTEEIHIRDNGICGICKLGILLEEATLDHIIPLSRGGTHTRANAQVAHDLCNKRKWAKLPEEVSA